MTLEFWILLRLLISAVLGGLVGYEREQTRKRAGLRTHMLVAVGATLFVSCNDLALEQSRTLGEKTPGILQVQVSLLSPVQAVATGIGFLGAGTIFMSPRATHVHGLTTAASIWGISAVGLAVGFDRFVVAAGATLLIWFVLHILVRFEHPHDPDRNGTGSSPPPS